MCFFIPKWEGSLSEAQTCMHLFMHAKLLQSCLTLCNQWTVACQAPLSMEFSSHEYWSGLPCPPPGNLPDSGVKPVSLHLLRWQAGSLLLEPPGKLSDLHSWYYWKSLSCSRIYSSPHGPQTVGAQQPLRFLRYLSTSMASVHALHITSNHWLGSCLMSGPIRGLVNMTESNRWAGKTNKQIALSPLDLGASHQGRHTLCSGLNSGVSWAGGCCSQQEELPLLASVGVLTSSVSGSMPPQMCVPGWRIWRILTKHVQIWEGREFHSWHVFFDRHLSFAFQGFPSLLCVGLGGCFSPVFPFHDIE